MLNKKQVIESFSEAAARMAEEKRVRSPRALAYRAHRIFCKSLAPDQKRPSPETFRKFAVGKFALPEIRQLCLANGVRTVERAKLDRSVLCEAFRQAAAQYEISGAGKHHSPALIARRAYEIYVLAVSGHRPSFHTFRRLVYGKNADAEILKIIGALVRARECRISLSPPVSKRARLDRNLALAAFRKAVQEMKGKPQKSRRGLLEAARRAHAIYLCESPDKETPPSFASFERLIYGRTADPEIVSLLECLRPDDRLIMNSFERALAELRGEGGVPLTPRAVAARAHALYGAAAGPGRRHPSLEVFRKFAAGRGTPPQVAEMLARANVRSAPRVRLDRERLRAVFGEAVQKLEGRIFRGRVKPLQLARRAYEIYTRGAEEESARPSRLTFQRLIYGRTGDPEIRGLIAAALNKPKAGS